MNKKTGTIRTIYLYLFSLVGLTLIVIGSVRFVDMGLKAFVFTKADDEARLNEIQPPIRNLYGIAAEKSDGTLSPAETVSLTEEQRASIGQWIEDYNRWLERRDEIDVVVARRHRDASTNLALILIGFPLYLYHWRLVRRDSWLKEDRS